MKIKKYLIIPILFPILWGCENRSAIVQPKQEMQTYPAINTALSQKDIDKLQNDFKVAYPEMSTATFDEYGFISMSHKRPDANGSSVWSKDKAIEMARSFILDVAEFVHLENSEDLLLNDSSKYGDRWIVTFQQQKLGIPVYNNKIRVLIYNSGVNAIEAGFYQNITVPEAPPFDQEAIANKITGYEFIFYCWGPVNVVLDKDMMGTEHQLVLYPLRKENYRQIHLAWQIPLTVSNSFEFLLFVDAITFEVLAVNPLFIC